MTRIPIVSGTKTAENGYFLNSFPINREPVLKDSGLSEGFLAVAPGITLKATGPGADRGGIEWNGICYRVMGSDLVRVSAGWAVESLGSVGAGGPCGFDYSFDNLIINSGDRLYYWNATDGLRQVTDPDLGVVIDAIFVDGYTMTTDGEFLVVTDLNDPMAVDPLKYGSSEESPDPVTKLVHMHGEVYAMNRTTVQVFQNVGGAGFPFRTVKTATVPFGCVGPRAACKYLGSVAFVGGAENSAPGIYLLGAGTAVRISAAEVDDDLAALTSAQLAAVWTESRTWRDEQRLIVHLPDRSWSFSQQVSEKSSVKTWCQYVTSKGASGQYEGRGLVYAYGQWIVGSSTGQVGVLDNSTAQHYGVDVGWQFDTSFLFNDTRGAILTEIRLSGTPGRGNADSRIFMSYTKDGETWSMERATPAGKLGQRGNRVRWGGGFRLDQYIGLRFRGVDGSVMGIARLDCEVEPLAA
jgi:hypothetical protein